MHPMTTNNNNKISVFAAFLFALLTVSACGGSGGGNNAQPPTPPPPPLPPAPTTPLPIDPANTIEVLTLPATFSENIVELSALVVDTLVLLAEERASMATVDCDTGTATLTLTDLNANGLPSAGETATLSVAGCQFNGSSLTVTGDMDLEIRSFVVDSNESARAKLRVVTSTPLTMVANGATHIASGAFEINYLGDDMIQTLDLTSRFADTFVLQNAAGEDDSFSDFQVMRTISATGILTTLMNTAVESGSVTGAFECLTDSELSGPLGNVLAEGTYTCTGATQSAARAIGTLGGNLSLSVDEDGDGNFADAGTIAGGTGTWADLFSNDFFGLTVRTPGVIPEQLLAGVTAISAAYAANDIVLSPDESRIYLSDDAGIRIVNAVDLTEIDQLALPATPGPLAVSDDGSTLWVGFSGAQRVQSVDLGTFTAGPQVPLGTSPNYASRIATALSVAPGQPQTVVVSMTNRNELVAYAGGTQLPNIVDSWAAPGDFEFISATQIAGIDGDTSGASLVTLDANGVSLPVDDILLGFETLNVSSMTAGQYIYTTSGRAFDPVARVVHGRIKLDQTQGDTSRDSVVIDLASDTVYLYNHGLGLIEGYDATTLVLLSAYTVTTNGNFVSMTDAGDGLVIATDSELVRVEKAELMANRNSSLCISVNLSGIIADGFFTEIECGFNDIVYSAVNNRIYAAMPSFAGINGNSIATIDTATGEILSTLFVGSEPLSLAMTPDESMLYVSFLQASKIAVVDLTQASISSYIDLELHETTSRPLLGVDVAVSPTANDSILVGAKNEVSSYLAGAKQGAALAGFLTVSDTFFKASGTDVLIQELNSKLTRATVGAGGVTLVSSDNVLVAARSLKYVGDTLYDRNGRVVDEVSSTILGTCAANPGFGTLLVEPAAASDSVYYIDQSIESMVTTCDETTFEVTSLRTLPSFGETVSVPKVLEEAGTNKLVLGTSDKLVIFDPTGIRN